MKKKSRRKRAELWKQKLKIENDAPAAVKYPDFAAPSKKIFDSRVLNADDDFLKYRHREWELALETAAPLPEKTRPEQSRSARRRRSRTQSRAILDV
jgi:hypothetical protein